MSKRTINKIIALLSVLVVLGVVGIIIFILNSKPTIENKNDIATSTTAEIEYATTSIPAEITLSQEINTETGQGAIEANEIPTIEAVGSNGPVTEENLVECPEGEECGQGAYTPSLDISTPQAFANAVLGQCIDVDGYYGSQCWDLMAAYFINYTGHTLYTCGTGAAKGTIADGCWQQNAGNDFTMIWNASEIQAGDIAVYSTGQWGHIGMAMGSYNNGYFTLLGENQGGQACPGGGGAANIINLSTRDFIGAFRPNIYIHSDPDPEPVDECKTWNVKAGDTLGQIMLTCRNEIKWGEEMNEYAKHWFSTIINSGNSVYYGWTHGTGYGLFAGDVIEYRD